LHRYVGPFLAKKERGLVAPTQFTNVYFKNIDEAITKEKLEEIFGAHGKITSCAIMQNEKGESKGFGFVNFEKPEEAEVV
jgi:polyadenylate-binding protein